MINVKPIERPDCDEMLNGKYLWALSSTEEIESEKFDAKTDLMEVLSLKNTENAINWEKLDDSYVFDIIKYKLSENTG